MNWLATIALDQIGVAFLAVFTIRELIVLVLPDDIAGSGWLVY